MFRRLLAALLLLALFAPAMAMSGHCATPPAQPIVHMGEHGYGHKPVPSHEERRDCIGCVLPVLGSMAALGGEEAGMLVGPDERRDALSSALRGPDTPPPRA